MKYKRVSMDFMLSILDILKYHRVSALLSNQSTRQMFSNEVFLFILLCCCLFRNSY